VPGLTYQPPLVGHKRLLNFDAYSFPDVAGWIVMAAGTLAFIVWFAEWYHQRKLGIRPKTISKVAVTAVLVMFFSSCSSKPEPFQYGHDVCYSCKMGMADPKFGGEVITKKGKVYKFDDVICMMRFLKSSEVKDANIAQKYLINFQKQNDFIDVTKAFLFVSPELRTPMGGDAAAFASRGEAEKMNVAGMGNVTTWNELLAKTE
jgi:copper chaperone NosL